MVKRTRTIKYSVTESITTNKTYMVAAGMEYQQEVDTLTLYVDTGSEIIMDNKKFWLEGGGSKNYSDIEVRTITIVPGSFPCRVSIEAMKEVEENA